MTSFSDASESSTSKFTSSAQWLPPCRKFTLYEILLATENFNESLVIGEGGFGKVYKGEVIVGTSHVAVAIKRLDLISDQGATEFWAEVEILSELRHFHLVSLIGYCNHEREMILVYEYMPNGTLEDHLHNLRTGLSWVDRLKICIGAALGLDYLHTRGTGFIHRDVKSSNILLNESWEAKISDFGLSKICPTNQPHTYVNTDVKGTFGYFDPYYYDTGHLTRKSDVFAFGVVLFEVLCRKQPVDRSLEYGLAKWAQDSIKEGNLKNIVDSDIRGEISPKCLKRFARIAKRCLEYHPKHRPTMTEVIFSLGSILTLELQTPSKSIFTRRVGVFPPFNPTDENPAQWLQPCRTFELQEILLATESFNESFVIGKGGSGNVYKGEVIVGTSHVAAAIKRLDLMSNQGEAEFWAEVEMLSKLRHSHLVSLIGYCNHEREMILVYEYMPNGTLEDHLHKLRTHLSWVDRLKICIGAARGLDYLHTGTGIEFGVIHRDVKCSNILLHESWAAKISDFGLSRIGPTNQPPNFVNTLVKGTFGYLDPNYFATGQLTRNSDVYAFGVVLFEVLCQKRPVDRSLEYGLATWAKESIKEGNLKKIVDSNIRNEIFPKCLKEFARIAVRCLEYHPKDRPTMSEVIFSLESVLTLQLQTPGKSIITRMVDVLPPFNSTSENPAKKREQLMLMKRFLEHNGPLSVIDQLLIIGAMNTFSAKTLKLATQNFASDMIIGTGGYSIVYKGILPNNRVVAIKKAKVSEFGPFRLEQSLLNEVVMLSKLNHQNVVQLLGCCLETEVPLLAYEYVCNGTLEEHIHTTGSGRRRLAWDTRLSIAYDTASALAYLHTNTIMSIVHRGVKSANILLDENLTAKITDFGASRLIPEDCDHVSTCVMGTFGYLDPEYSHTGELRHKSDVYSFGVVLVELLTGHKPLHFEKVDGEYISLSTYFVNLKRENRLTEIVENQVLQEATDEQLKAACDLACSCLEEEGENRPSMKEVAMELDKIKKLGNDMHDESELADSDIFFSMEKHNHHQFIQGEKVDPESDISEDEFYSDIFENNDIFGEQSSSSTPVKEITRRTKSWS